MNKQSKPLKYTSDSWEKKLYETIAQDLGYDWPASDKFYETVRQLRTEWIEEGYQKGIKEGKKNPDISVAGVCGFEAGREDTILQIKGWAEKNKNVYDYIPKTGQSKEFIDRQDLIHFLDKI